MLTLTGIEELRRHGARIAFDVSIGAPVSKNITKLMGAIPIINSGVKINARTPNIGNIGLVLDNVGNEFSSWNSASIFNVKIWHGADVTIKLGHYRPNGTTSLVSVFVGLLENAKVNSARGTVELIVSDYIARLRRDTVHFEDVYDSSVPSGVQYQGRSPAFIVNDICTRALGSAKVDTTSFADAINEEYSEGLVIRQYDMPRSTWFSALEGILKQANAGIRINVAGNVEYYKFLPLVGAVPVWAFDSVFDVSDVIVEETWGGVVNKYQVSRVDESGVVEDSANSPIENTQSITDYGEVSKTLSFGFINDYPAESTARETLDYTKVPFKIIKLTAPFDSFVVELGDLVSVTDKKTGLSAQKAFVMNKSINTEGRKVEFTLHASAISDDAWIFTENSQQLDNAQLLW